MDEEGESREGQRQLHQVEQEQLGAGRSEAGQAGEEAGGRSKGSFEVTVEADSVVERTPLHTYSNGGFEVQLYGDGTKVRRTVAQEIAPTLPEQFDLKVTNFCDGGCAWCHEDSTKKGSHGDLVATLDLLRCLNRQIA